MKRVFALLISIMIVFPLTGCGNISTSIKQKMDKPTDTGENTEDGHDLVEVVQDYSYSVKNISFYDEYPDCRDIGLCSYDSIEFTVKDEITEKIEEDFNSSHDGLFPEFLDFAESIEPDDTMNYMDYYEIADVYNDDRYLCITEKFSWYGGGAHGENDEYASTYDLSTGERITVVDLFYGDARAASDLIAAKTLDYYYSVIDPDGSDTTMTDSIKNKDVFRCNFSIDGEYLNIIYNVYEIASYSTGMHVVKIPLNELPQEPESAKTFTEKEICDYVNEQTMMWFMDARTWLIGRLSEDRLIGYDYYNTTDPGKSGYDVYYTDSEKDRLGVSYLPSAYGIKTKSDLRDYLRKYYTDSYIKANFFTKLDQSQYVISEHGGGWFESNGNIYFEYLSGIGIGYGKIGDCRLERKGADRYSAHVMMCNYDQEFECVFEIVIEDGRIKLDSSTIGEEKPANYTDNPAGSDGTVMSVSSELGLKLRSGPSTEYDEIAQMPYQAQIIVYNIDSGWAYCSYNGLYGYCSAEYIK